MQSPLNTSVAPNVKLEQSVFLFSIVRYLPRDLINSLMFLIAVKFPDILHKWSPCTVKDVTIRPHTHTHTRYRPFSRTTWVSQHQKGKPFWILLTQEMNGWQWHQLDHVQIICTTLQTDNHVSNHHSIFYGPDALPDTQPTASKH